MFFSKLNPYIESLSKICFPLKYVLLSNISCSNICLIEFFSQKWTKINPVLIPWRNLLIFLHLFFFTFCFQCFQSLSVQYFYYSHLAHPSDFEVYFECIYNVIFGWTWQFSYYAGFDVIFKLSLYQHTKFIFRI